jgi:hypothetical protein
MTYIFSFYIVSTTITVLDFVISFRFSDFLSSRNNLLKVLSLPRQSKSPIERLRATSKRHPTQIFQGNQTISNNIDRFTRLYETKIFWSEMKSRIILIGFPPTATCSFAVSAWSLLAHRSFTQVWPSLGCGVSAWVGFVAEKEAGRDCGQKRRQGR